MNPLSRLGTLLHDELVSLYSSTNGILAALVVLGVVHLTPDQIAAWIFIISVTLGPLVNSQTQPVKKNAVTNEDLLSAVTAVLPSQPVTQNWHLNVGDSAKLDPTRVGEAFTRTMPGPTPSENPPEVPPPTEEPPAP